MGSLLSNLSEFIRANGTERTYWIAYSGGMDSHVLLHLFAQLVQHNPLTLRAVYINHGVSANALQWALHCAEVCEKFNIAFDTYTLTPSDSTTSSSLEDKLRQARYQIFANLLAPDDMLVTAHHQNDQAETLLLQLLRGAGPKGLAAMPRIKAFAKGTHGRPLLDVTRQDLACYAKQHQLQWIEDESNTNIDFNRNFLRHCIMPLLTERWPTVTKLLARSATHCAEMQDFVETVAQQWLEETKGSMAETLSVKKILQLDHYQQTQVLRAWILQRNFPLPPLAKMRCILPEVLLAGVDKMPILRWGQVEMRRYRDDLFLQSCLSQHDAYQTLEWNLAEPCLLSGLGEWRAVIVEGRGMRTDVQRVTVKFRQGGEVLRLPGRQHHHELKKLLQDWGVPPWLRNSVPLIYVDNQLAAVAGLCVTAEFAVQQGQLGWVFLGPLKDSKPC